MLSPVRNRKRRYSPATGLLLGLIITLAAVVMYSRYVTFQISDLRQLQTGLVDRNRRESLQLLRIQNNLNSAAHAMRDILDDTAPYPLTAWSSQFERLRTDLEDALRLVEEASAVYRTTEQLEYLQRSTAEFWGGVDRMFALAREGQDEEARALIRFSLQARQAALSNAVARLLVENNESSQEASSRIQQVYAEVERRANWFLTATLAAILMTGLYLIHSNRRIFAELSLLSEQRSDLARALISSQESTLHHISRELHDEFGQVLTAMGTLLARTRRQVPDDSPVHRDLQEVCEIAQSVLDSVRGMSQALHPAILDEAGFESAVDWLISMVERRTDLEICYEKSGTPFEIDAGKGIHVYRLLQEALNNVTRHSGVQKAWVKLRYTDSALELEVEDHGKGFAVETAPRGIGLIAMRERAQILDGTIEFLKPREGGVKVALRIPRPSLERLSG
jgi:signal transduction histidine kinase